MIHRIQILELVASEVSVEAASEDEAFAVYEAGRFSQRHRVVLDRTESVGFPPMSWDEFVAESKAEAKRRNAIVTAWDEAETARAEARKAGRA